MLLVFGCSLLTHPSHTHTHTHTHTHAHTLRDKVVKNIQGGDTYT